MERVCAEMQNYSEYTVEGKKCYKRYQNRPGETEPLKLKHFGWSCMLLHVVPDLLACNGLLSLLC